VLPPKPFDQLVELIACSLAINASGAGSRSSSVA
jgi:hypothetical protein